VTKVANTYQLECIACTVLCSSCRTEVSVKKQWPVYVVSWCNCTP